MSGDRNRAFTRPMKDANANASDYVNNLRAKVKFAGTSNLARTVAVQGGMLPLRTPQGHLKPYQGTYGFSSTTNSPKTYCLNTSRSYRDLLDITKGKYLLTPPNPVANTITLDNTEPSELYNGVFFENTYVGNAMSIYSTSAFGIDNNNIIYATSSPAAPSNSNQLIFGDPSYNMFYESQSCLDNDTYFRNIEIRTDLGINGKKHLDRVLNLYLLNGFKYPSKFSLDYNSGDCINTNNDLQIPECPLISLQTIATEGPANTWTLNSNVTILPCQTLTILAGQRLNIDNNLNNYGTIQNNGTFNVNVTFTNYSGGTINNNAGGIITNNNNFNNNAGGTINNNNGATITNNRTITNAGTITNNGTITTTTNTAIITNTATITNSASGVININSSSSINNTGTGTITNAGTIAAITGGVITNTGTITNSNTITANSGTITNNSGGVINNNNSGTITTISGSIQNIAGGTINNNTGGIINNSYTSGISNYGTITNSVGGTITNAINSNITNYLAITNYGTITNNRTIINNGAITNDGASATITNDGASATITNNGTFTNKSGGVLTNTNSATITNNSGATIANGVGFAAGLIFNKFSGIITNNFLATFNNLGVFNNYSVTESAVFNQYGTYTGFSVNNI